MNQDSHPLAFFQLSFLIRLNLNSTIKNKVQVLDKPLGYLAQVKEIFCNNYLLLYNPVETKVTMQYCYSALYLQDLVEEPFSASPVIHGNGPACAVYNQQSLIIFRHREEFSLR